MSVYKGKVR